MKELEFTLDRLGQEVRVGDAVDVKINLSKLHRVVLVQRVCAKSVEFDIPIGTLDPRTRDHVNMRTHRTRERQKAVEFLKVPYSYYELEKKRLSERLGVNL